MRCMDFVQLMKTYLIHMELLYDRNIIRSHLLFFYVRFRPWLFITKKPIIARLLFNFNNVNIFKALNISLLYD